MNEQDEENREEAQGPAAPPAPGAAPASPQQAGPGAPEEPKPEEEKREKEEKQQEAKEEKAAEIDYDASGLDPDPDVPGTDKPLYGQMLSQYPGYNPYIFGAPDSSSQAPKEEARPAEGGDNPFSDAYGAQGPAGGPQGQQGPQNFQNPPQNTPPQFGQQGQNPYFGQQPPQNPYYGQPYQGSQQGSFGGFGYGPQAQNPYAGKQENINTADPRQNPYYGKMDGFAVMAFVASLLGIWLVGLPLGIFSLIRIKQLHTRGRGLAIAAIVLSCLYIVLDIVLFFFGITDQQIVSWITQKLGAGAGSGLRI
ncbi:MAG: DUF4190 domain-containing protein [Aeriscardovia sp.]|nr:DUF4190 domain-containing protein [Aeriscardovia sp.]